LIVSLEQFDPLNDVVRVLQEPVMSTPEARARVMDAVRSAPRPSAPAPVSTVATLRVISRKRSRGPALTTLAVAAGLGSIVALGLGRTQPIGSAPLHGVGALGDTVAATLRDTVRLVQFMLVAPAASRVALAGDFNGWNARGTPLSRSSDASPWTVAIAVPPGQHRYAFVVDDTQWVRGSVKIDK
jgi:hypothetical protein